MEREHLPSLAHCMKKAAQFHTQFELEFIKHFAYAQSVLCTKSIKLDPFIQ